jgi:CRISPR-associated endonuclease Csn1
MAIVLGLDLGVTSVGWALIDEQSQKVLDAGSRIFSPGVNVSPVGKEESKNANRRQARQTRRQIFRRKQRQDLVLQIFQSLRWLPTDETYLEEIFKTDPYQLRKKALDEALSLQELARILYHLSKRRGFKSSRKSGDTDDGTLFKGDEKLGKIGINELSLEMEQRQCRTIGEYFAGLDTHTKRIRSRYVLRSQYQDEFEQIWEAQLRFHPEIQKPLTYEGMVRQLCSTQQREKWLKQDLYTFLKEYAIYFQRPLKSQKGLIGKCFLESTCKRAPLSAPHVQEFRIWDKLYSITLTGEGRADSPLSSDEMTKAFEWLNVSKEKTIDDLLKYLKLTAYEANYKTDTKLKGNRTAHALMSVFGKQGWANMNTQQQFDAWKLVYDAEDNDFLVQYGQQKWNLTDEQAQKLAKVSFEKDYASLSSKAINKLLPLMRTGRYSYSAACQEVGYHHSQANVAKGEANQLPEPPLKRNPIVQQALNELKKVVNTLVQSYGLKPDEIRVELARELKMPKQKRETILADNKAREREHERIWNVLKHDFRVFANVDPSSDDIVKYKLWEECNHICPYTGDQISKELLYNPAFEVEHIIPYSRSLDDSFQNKTLCKAEFNRNIKKEMIPYEMLERSVITQEQYDAILERVKTFRKNGQFPVGKFRRFLRKSVSTDFVSQQLNDTAYLSREAKSYLSHICPKVQVSNGQSTAILRHLWGLNRVLNPQGVNLKTREDHRHHAVDAVVVACTTPAMLKRLSGFNQKGKTATARDFPFPWATFRQDVKTKVNEVLISHRHKSRVRGKLHDETMYGAVRGFDQQQQKDDKGLPVFTVRKDLRSLSPAMIHKIADPVIRQLVLNRLAQFGVNTSEKFTIPPNAFTAPLYMPTKSGVQIQIKKVRIHDVGSNKIEIRPGVFVDPGNNHHIVIFQKSNGKRDGDVVSLYEATRRRKNGEPVVQTDCGDGNTFIMSLSANEMVLVDTDEFKTADIDWNHISQAELSKHLYRVQKMTISGQMFFRHHLVAVLKDKMGNEPGLISKSPATLDCVKVKINPIGEIEKA